GINRLADTIEDRSFKISMVRKTKSEKVARFNLKKQSEELKKLRAEIELWARTRKGDIETLYASIEEIPELEKLDDRFKDISEPLVSIAGYADAEALNGQEKILPAIFCLLQDLAGTREEAERGEAIGSLTVLAEEVLERKEAIFVSTGDLLA